MKNQIATSLRFSQRRLSRHREPLLRGDLHFNALVCRVRSAFERTVSDNCCWCDQLKIALYILLLFLQ